MHPAFIRLTPSALKALTDENFEYVKARIAEEESRRKTWERLEMAVEAVNTNDPYFKAAGLALLYVIRTTVTTSKCAQREAIVDRCNIQLPEDFSPKEHAYHLAEVAGDNYASKAGWEADDRDRVDFNVRLGKHFDESEFVACFTHYDECQNGHYFRRS